MNLHRMLTVLVAFACIVNASTRGGPLAARVRINKLPSRALPCEAAPSIRSTACSWSGYFEPNVGQFPGDVCFAFSSPAARAVFRDSGVDVIAAHGGPGSGADQPAFRVEFVGGGPHIRRPVGESPTGPRVSYLLGRGDPRFSDVETFERVCYSDIYPGVDVVWRASGDTIEYLLEASDPDALREVRVRLRGASGLRRLPSGELTFQFRNGTAVQSPPVDVTSGGLRVAHCRYRVVADDEFVFDVARGGGGRVVIDPVLRLSTVSGGSRRTLVNAVRTDSIGAVYVAGTTWAAPFEVLGSKIRTRRHGQSDAFVYKIDTARARLEFVTFLGGRRHDEARGLAVGADGSVFVVGETWSSDFPLRNEHEGTAPGLQPEAFVTQLDPGRSEIAFSTYLAGLAYDNANAVALESNGDCVVVGGRANVTVQDEPCTCGGEDARILRFERDTGRLKQSILIGGADRDEPLGVAVGAGDVAYVVGWTRSTDFPVTQGSALQGSEDGFLLAVAPDGQVVFSRLVGGGGADVIEDCAIGPDGTLHFAGRTSSPDLPTQGALQASYGGAPDDGLIGGVDAAGNLAYLSYLGGLGSDSASGIAVDQQGAVYVCGGTDTSNFPALASFQPEPGASFDAFVVKLAPEADALEYASRLGANGHEYATGIANLSDQQVVVTGSTTSSAFPLASSIGSLRASRRATGAFVSVIDASSAAETAHLDLRAARLSGSDGGVAGFMRGALVPVPSLSDGDLDPSMEPVEIEFAVEGGLVVLTIPAQDPAWRSRRRGVRRWSGTFGNGGTGTVVVDTRRFKMSASFEGVPATGTLAGIVRVRVRIGDDESSHMSEWILVGSSLRFRGGS